MLTIIPTAIFASRIKVPAFLIGHAQESAARCESLDRNNGQRLMKANPSLTPAQIDRIIMMAWEDRTSFDAIGEQFGLSPGDVIKLMRSEMTARSFRMWRKRTAGRTTKHESKFAQTGAGKEIRRFRAKGQRG